MNEQEMLKAYRRERKRIQTELSRMRKMGYVANIALPQVVKNNDNGMLETYYNAVKSLTNREIRVRSVKSVKPGEYISYEENKLRNSRRKVDKKALYDLYEANWFNMINHYPTIAEPFLTNFTTRMISQIGRENFYDGVNQAMKDGYTLTYRTAYNLESLADFANGLYNYFNIDKTDLNDVIDLISQEDIYSELYS